MQKNKETDKKQSKEREKQRTASNSPGSLKAFDNLSVQELKQRIIKVTDECSKLRNEHAHIAKENARLNRQYDDIFKDNTVLDSSYGKN